MFRRRLEQATAFLLTQQDNLDRNERAYKIEGADRTRAHLDDFLAGKVTKVNVQRPQDLNLLSWQIVDGLNTMANTRPEVFRAALSALWEGAHDPRQADAFWGRLDPALDALSDLQRKHFGGLGTRASVASYFLFLVDPTGHPFYRPNYGGRAVKWLYDRKDGLDERTLGSLLVDYVGRCRYLHREFVDGGVGLRDMLDTQGALYILSTQYLPDARTARGR